MISALLIYLMVIGSGNEPAPCREIADIRYEITSSLDFSAKSLTEHTRIIFHADSTKSDTLMFWCLQLPEDQKFSIDSILVNGMSFRSSLEADDMTIQDLPVARLNRTCTPDSLVFSLCAKEALTDNINAIDFFYKLEFAGMPCIMNVPIPESYPYMDYYPRLVHDTDSIYSLDQRFSSLEQYSLKITAPRDLHFMSEAVPRRVELPGDSVEYHIDSLRTSQIIWLVFPEAYHKQDTSNVIPIDIYLNPDCKYSGDKAREITDAIAFYKPIFGGVPYDKINIIFTELPDELGGGAANGFLLLPGDKSSSSYVQRIMNKLSHSPLPHEAAHLWWGCSVNIRDVWLAEGFACYWAEQYGTFKEGPEYQEDLEYEFKRVLYRLNREKPNKGQDDWLFIKHYFKAQAILSMLALEIGTEGFNEACREYYQRYRGCSPGVAEFKEVVQRHSTVPLDQFFTSWVDSTYRQNYSIGKIESEFQGITYTNSLILSKSGKAVSCVPVEVCYKDKTSESFLLRPGQLTYNWTSNSRVKSVFIDPDHRILEEKRYDNAKPTPVRFHRFKLKPTEDIKLFSSMFSDEPVYRLYLLPDIPAHSRRFGWEYSGVLLGEGEDCIRDYFLDNIDVLRIGYNQTTNGLIYRCNISRKMSNSEIWRSTYHLLSERMRGRYESGMGIKWARYFSINQIPIPIPLISTTIDFSHRNYYNLNNVDESIWPLHDTTPLTVRITLFLNTTLRYEKGFKVFPEDKAFDLLDLTIEKESRYYYGRLFVGTSHGDAAQERFDAAEEGGFKSYPPFSGFHDHLLAANLLLKHKLISKLDGRLFGNYMSTMNGDQPVFEFGFGLSVGNRFLGIALDMPVYIDDPEFDEKRWNFDRFQVQASLFNFKGIPRWDFLID